MDQQAGDNEAVDTALLQGIGACCLAGTMGNAEGRSGAEMQQRTESRARSR